MKSRLHRILRRLFVLAALLPCAACDDSGGKTSTTKSPEREKITVLATVYPLADIARRIGGSNITIEWAAESGQALPGDEAPLELRARAELSDIVISAGEAWAARGYDDPFRAQRIIRLNVMQSVAASPVQQGLAWLDPLAARELALTTTQRFSSLRPKKAYIFEQRSNEFVRDLDLLIEQYDPVLKTSPPRQALVLSGDWDRMLARFGVHPLRPINASPSTISTAQARQLAEVARQNQITSLFISADTPPAVVRDLQEKTDLTVLTLDALGTSADSGRGNTYLELMRYNLDQLHRGASRAR